MPMPSMPESCMRNGGEGSWRCAGIRSSSKRMDSREDVGKTTDEAIIVRDLKKEDWNEYRVVAQGNRLVHEINGHVTVEVVDNESSKRSMSGLLALQLHAGPPMKVQFKEIQLKQLPACARCRGFHFR